jgi:uncharacterized phiE125 gp8 family phage protein
VADSVFGIFGTPYPTRFRQLPNVRTIEVVTAPTIEPVSVAEAKAQSRVTDSSQDALIAGFVSAARQYVESVTGLALVEQTWRVSFDFFETPLKLPGGKIKTLDGFEYTDQYNATQTIDTATGCILDKIKGRLFPTIDARFPTAGAVPGAVRVTYTLGAPVNNGAVVDRPAREGGNPATRCRPVREPRSERTGRERRRKSGARSLAVRPHSKPHLKETAKMPDVVALKSICAADFGGRPEGSRFYVEPARAAELVELGLVALATDEPADEDGPKKKKAK